MAPLLFGNFFGPLRNSSSNSRQMLQFSQPKQSRRPCEQINLQCLRSAAIKVQTRKERQTNKKRVSKLLQLFLVRNERRWCTRLNLLGNPTRDSFFLEVVFTTPEMEKDSAGNDPLNLIQSPSMPLVFVVQTAFKGPTLSEFSSLRIRAVKVFKSNQLKFLDSSLFESLVR